MPNSSCQRSMTSLFLCAQLEMILQAQEYEKAQGINLQEFFESTKGKFQTELGKSWAAEIVARREAFIEKGSSSEQ